MLHYNSSFQQNNSSSALGLEETTSGVWKLFTAVIIHAVAIVFCIGEQILREMSELGKTHGSRKKRK
jgi:hypothetical protein